MRRFVYFTNPQGPQPNGAIACIEDGRVYVWVANTHLWHRHRAFETILVINDTDMEIRPVEIDQVAGYMARTHTIDGRGYSGVFLRKLKALPDSEKRTSAELGLLTRSGERPIANPAIVALLGQMPAGESRQIARYAAERHQTADNFVYEVNHHKKKSLADLGLTARTREDAGQIVVEFQREPG